MLILSSISLLSRMINLILYILSEFCEFFIK